MAIEVNWTDEAQESFSHNIDYLLNEWSEREVEKFVNQTEQVIKRLHLFPESYPKGVRNKQYRRARLNKYIVLFYRYYKTKSSVTLVSFWNIKRDPANMPY